VHTHWKANILEVVLVNTVCWQFYPLVDETETARTWLEIQHRLQLAPKTIDAYGRSLNDFLGFCARYAIEPETVTREQVALYVQDLATRPNPKSVHVLTFPTGCGLSNSTMQQRITVLRLFCDYLIEKQLRPDNPVGRGHYVPGKGFAGARDRGLIPHFKVLPWIPDDSEWLRILTAFKQECLRNRVMFCLAYDGALRREEVVTLELGDFDVAYRQIHIRPEVTKGGRSRVVGYSAVSSRLLSQYLQRRRELSNKAGPLFLSESHRHFAGPISLMTWSKVVEKIADQIGLPRLTTHTLRHLRLTHMARARLDLHQIATYAGHASLETTLQYIHLAGVELTEAVSRSLAGFEQWMENILEGETP